VIIPLYRNIPIITYIIQKGKCHQCHCPINISYPAIELITAIIFLLGLNNSTSPAEYILFLWISSILISISIIDYKIFIIPISLLFLILIGEISFLMINLNKLSYMISGMLFGLGYLGLTFLITSIIYKKQTLGYGDLLLISLIGLWLGPINILICIFLSAIIGITIWIMKYFNNKNNEKLPFGSYLSISAIFLKILNIDFILYINNL